MLEVFQGSGHLSRAFDDVGFGVEFGLGHAKDISQKTCHATAHSQLLKFSSSSGIDMCDQKKLSNRSVAVSAMQ